MSAAVARDVTCPNCNAQPGQPCTQPTDTSRKAVAWVHSAREVNAEKPPTPVKG